MVWEPLIFWAAHTNQGTENSTCYGKAIFRSFSWWKGYGFWVVQVGIKLSNKHSNQRVLNKILFNPVCSERDQISSHKSSTKKIWELRPCDQIKKQVKKMSADLFQNLSGQSYEKKNRALIGIQLYTGFPYSWSIKKSHVLRDVVYTLACVNLQDIIMRAQGRAPEALTENNNFFFFMSSVSSTIRYTK